VTLNQEHATLEIKKKVCWRVQICSGTQLCQVEQETSISLLTTPFQNHWWVIVLKMEIGHKLSNVCNRVHAQFTAGSAVQHW